MIRFLLFLFLLTSCQKEDKTDLIAPCERTHLTSCTPLIKLERPGPDLIYTGDMGIDFLTAYLARQDRCESENIGFSGSFSEVYQAYIRLQRQASIDQLKLLLKHRSVNVRYYAILGLAERDPKNKKNHYQQLKGKYELMSYLDGCVGSKGMLYEFASYQLFVSKE